MESSASVESGTVGRPNHNYLNAIMMQTIRKILTARPDVYIVPWRRFAFTIPAHSFSTAIDIRSLPIRYLVRFDSPGILAILRANSRAAPIRSIAANPSRDTYSGSRS